MNLKIEVGLLELRDAAIVRQIRAREIRHDYSGRASGMSIHRGGVLDHRKRKSGKRIVEVEEYENRIQGNRSFCPVS